MTQETTTALVVASPALATAVLGVLTLYHSRKTHKLVNSRMTELVDLVRKNALKDGAQQEKDNPS